MKLRNPPGFIRGEEIKSEFNPETVLQCKDCKFYASNTNMPPEPGADKRLYICKLFIKVDYVNGQNKTMPCEDARSSWGECGNEGLSWEKNGE